jgi:hypothetical protein
MSWRCADQGSFWTIRCISSAVKARIVFTAEVASDHTRERARADRLGVWILTGEHCFVLSVSPPESCESSTASQLLARRHPLASVP